MKKRQALFLLFLCFSISSANSECHRKILMGVYVSGQSNREIRINKGNYRFYGNRIEIRCDESEKLDFTVFSSTSFGNMHEIYSWTGFY